MIVPCIDLLNGKVVQLIGGEKQALEADLEGVMERFAPFEWLHVIDLSAALSKGSNAFIAADIVRHRGEKPVRLGGGIRDLGSAAEALATGARQVIVGTAAFNENGVNEEFLGELAAKFGPERLCVALDCKNGHVAVRGWKATVALKPEDVIGVVDQFAESVLCTYVDAEGTMRGTNVPFFFRLRARTKARLIAAGGVGTIDEIRHLHAEGLDVALGMALYTGKLALADLLELNASEHS